eukprot:1304950-Lingulodinium_polyedra.AAC.1
MDPHFCAGETCICGVQGPQPGPRQKWPFRAGETPDYDVDLSSSCFLPRCPFYAGDTFGLP